MERLSAVPPVVQLVQAIYDYQGENNDELCIAKGDIITVTQTPDGGWFEGTLDGITGWFPSNYTVAVPVTASPSTRDQSSDSDRSNHHPDQGSAAQVMQSRLNQHQDNLKYRKMVIREIIESESSFVRELSSMHQTFLSLLHESKILPDGETQAARDAIAAIISSHSQFLTAIHSLESGNHSSSRSVRIGGLFMRFAPDFKQVHTDYCSIHPKFVSLIGQHKDQVSQLLASQTVTATGSSTASGGKSQIPATFSLSNSLSFAFRRLDKYPALLQELQRYTDESDADRGDTQRAGHFYRELVSHCLEVRRKKEMELEVMLGNIKDWPDDVPSVQTFGPIILMENVIVIHSPEGDVHQKDRYLVLFERDLLLLSISREMTSFRFETRIPVRDMTLPRQTPAACANQTLEILVTKVTAEEASGSSSGKFVFLFSSPSQVDAFVKAMHESKRKHDSVAIRYSSVRPAAEPSPIIRAKQSESSSLSSGSWTEHRNPSAVLSARKSPAASSSLTTSGYWSTHSLLPHPVLSLPDVDPAVAAKINAKKLKPKPADDMAILQVIEAYCPPGSTFKKKPISSSSPANASSNASDGPSDLKSLTEEVRVMRKDMKQMRVEMECLADALRREKEERKKLEKELESLLSYRHMT